MDLPDKAGGFIGINKLIYLFKAYVSPKRAVDLMASIISCRSASINSAGEVYVSNSVSEILWPEGSF